MISPERFWARVDRSGGPTACWPWLGARGRRGYGQLQVDGLDKRAARVAWELTNGPIPSGMLVCHRCDNPPCCNPAHLFSGTHADNSRDAAEKGRLARTKLTPSIRADVRRRLADGEGIRALAREYGVDHSRISRLTRVAA